MTPLVTALVIWLAVCIPSLLIHLVFEIDKIHRAQAEEIAAIRAERRALLERLLAAKMAGAEVPPEPVPEIPEEPLSPTLLSIISDFESPEGQRRAEQRIREMRSTGLKDTAIAKQFEVSPE